MKTEEKAVGALAMVSSEEVLPVESEINAIVRIDAIDGEIVEGAEYPGDPGSKDQGSAQPESLDPVKAFTLWLEQATPKDLEEAEPKLEEMVLGCHRNGRAWRLAMGEHLYKHREVVKKRGSRDWTEWVTDTLEMARQSAYDLMRRWTEEYGYGLEDHNEPDQPNPKAEAIKETIEKAREKRKGRGRSTSTPELSDHVRVPWPELFVTRDARDRFKEARERDEESVYRICRAAFFVVIGEADPEEKPDANGGAIPVPAEPDGAGQEETNVGAGD